MQALSGMFSKMPPATLSMLLEANSSSVERTVDYLLGLSDRQLQELAQAPGPETPRHAAAAALGSPPRGEAPKRAPEAAARGGAAAPSPLPIEKFDQMCDLTIRPQNLAETMKDTIDRHLRSRDLADIAAVVKKARTRFGGHTDVQVELTSLRVHEAKLRHELDAGSEPPAPARCAIIGAGYVGARVAAELIIVGQDVRIYDLAGAARVRQAVAEGLEDAQRSGYCSKADAVAALRRLTAAGSVGEAVSGCCLICECVADSLAVKGEVLGEVLQHCQSDAVIGSSTANLSLAAIQALLPEPWQHRLIGLRFLAPIVGVSLVEVSHFDGPDRFRVEGPPSRPAVKQACEILIGLGKCAVVGRADGGLKPVLGPGFRTCEEMKGRLNEEDLAAFKLRPNAKALVLASAGMAAAAPKPQPRPEAAAVITQRVLRLPNRTEIERGAFAFVLHKVFTREECQALIDASEQRGYEAALVDTGEGGSRQVLDRSRRNSCRNIWDNEPAAQDIFERVRNYLPTGPQSFGYPGAPREWQCVGLNERLRFLRYDAGHYFRTHMDGTYLREDGSAQSFLTLMLYLCDGGGADFSGGETRFVRATLEEQTEGASVEETALVPAAGDVLIFTHPVLHEGCEVLGGRKYCVRTDVMYSV